MLLLMITFGAARKAMLNGLAVLLEYMSEAIIA